MTEPDDETVTIRGGVLLAGQISVVACEHGHIIVRLHDGEGSVFAVGVMDLPLAADIERRIGSLRGAIAVGAHQMGACAGHG